MDLREVRPYLGKEEGDSADTVPKVREQVRGEVRVHLSEAPAGGRGRLV